MNYETENIAELGDIKKPKKCKEKLAQYKERIKEEGLPSVEPLHFPLNQDEFVKKITAPFQKSEGGAETIAVQIITLYNPSKPFESDGKRRIALRVEPIDKEAISKIMFFEETNGEWQLVEGAPILDGYQDPFFMNNVQGYKIFGGVQTYPDPEKPTELAYRTVFYRYKDNINEIEKPFAVGPDKMKDIRLIELPSGKIGVFTRPQGGQFGRGKIGYIEIDSLEELGDAISKATIIEGIFPEDEWGGVNDLHILKNGQIGIIGHIAELYVEPRPDQPKGQEIKNYYATAAVFNPSTGEMTDWEIIATADDLGFSVEKKMNSLGSVIFSGGSRRNEDGTLDLYAGVNDTKAVKFTLKDPFLKFEN